MTATYIIAIGSNRRGRAGSPRQVVAAAIAALADAGMRIVAVSKVRATRPLGPGGRAYANAAILAEVATEPAALLGLMKRIEVCFGRRPGRRWGDRVLDLDLIAAGALVRRGDPVVPHPRAHQRRFVLDALADIAPDWRHPLLGATARQLRARLLKPRRRDAGP